MSSKLDAVISFINSIASPSSSAVNPASFRFAFRIQGSCHVFDQLGLVVSARFVFGLGAGHHHPTLRRLPPSAKAGRPVRNIAVYGPMAAVHYLIVKIIISAILKCRPAIPHKEKGVTWSTCSLAPASDVAQHTKHSLSRSNTRNRRALRKLLNYLRKFFCSTQTFLNLDCNAQN